jgi:RNA polymerase sigma-70 factor, ECF subfamily
MDMERSEADRLFRAFVRGGDPRALGEVYDLLAPELLRLALHTTRDAAEAEDVLQATFVAAIERAASFDATRRVLPWLIGILAHEARKARARERRSPEPERLVREPVADAALEAERAEVLAHLDAALARLPEAFRPVLQLRLRHGLTVPEIAAALGRPPGTVRSQLARGTEALRRALPAGLADARVGALALVGAPTRGLAAVRSAVLEHGALLHGPLRLSTVIGGLLAVKKLVALVLVLVLGSWLWQRALPSSEEADARPPAAAEPVAAAREPAPLTARAEPTPRAEREALAPAPAAAPAAPIAAPTPGGALRVHARWPDGADAEGELVLLTAPDGRSDQALVLTTDARGLAEAGGLATGPWNVRLLRGAEDTAKVREGRTAELELAVRAGAAVTGTVRDTLGESVAGAEVWLSERYRNDIGHVVARSDERGEFRLRCVGPDHWIGARRRGFAPSSLRAVRAAPGDELALELVLEGPGAELRGQVLDELGAPVAHAWLLVGAEVPPSVRSGDGSFVPAAPPQRTRADAQGFFALEALPPGEQPLQARAPGFAPLATTVELHPVFPNGGARNELDVRLLRAARVRGRVLDSSGEPVAEAWVRCQAPERFASTSAWSQGDGDFTLADLGLGTVTLVAEHRRHGRAEHTFELAAGDERSWEVRLARKAGLRGRMLDARGEPCADLVVVAVDPADRERRWRSGPTAADGRFEIQDLEPREHLLWVQPPLGWREFPLLEQSGVWPGEDELVLRLPDSSESGRLTAEVHASDGTPLAGAELHVWHVERRQWRSYASAGELGRLAAEGIPPGTLDLELRHAAQPWLPLGERTLAAGETLELGTLVFEPAGTLRVRLANPDLLPPDLKAVLVGPSNREAGVARIVDDELLAGPLAPGAHTLVLTGEGLCQVRRLFRIEPDVETAFELALEPCAERQVRLELPAGCARPSWLGASLLDADGRLVWGGHADEENVLRVTAPPGSYRLVARSQDGLAGEEELVVGAPGTSAPCAVLVLRREP